MVERGHRSTWLWHGDGTRAESASLAMRQAGRPARPGLLVCGGAPRRNRPGDPILTMEPSGTAVRTTLSPGHARPYRPKLSVLFRQSYALTLAPCPDRRWRSHHSRSKDRQLSYLPASLILIPFPLGGGSAVLGVERGIGQEGHGGVGRPQDRSGVNRNTRRPDPSSPLVPARHRRRPVSRCWQIPVALAGPTHGRMVLGGDRCRQPSCRGAPPAPWCLRVSNRVGHQRVGCPR
jgi:hypothetical protein